MWSRRAPIAKAASDWVRNQPGAVEAVPAARLAELIGLISAGTITATIAKQVYALLEAEPSTAPAELVERHGLGTVGDSSELDALVAQVIDANPALVEQFRGGKDGVINALVGPGDEGDPRPRRRPPGTGAPPLPTVTTCAEQVPSAAERRRSAA